MLDFQTPPCSSNEILQYTFNFNHDNLKSYLDYLLQNDRYLLQELSTIKSKTDNIKDYKYIIDDLLGYKNISTDKLDELFISNQNILDKIKEIEKNSLSNKLEALETNINSLNRLNEDNIRRIEITEKNNDEKANQIKSLSHRLKLQEELNLKSEEEHNYKNELLKKITDSGNNTIDGMNRIKDNINLNKKKADERIVELEDSVFTLKKQNKEVNYKIKYLNDEADNLNVNINQLMPIRSPKKSNKMNTGGVNSMEIDLKMEGGGGGITDPSIINTINLEFSKIKLELENHLLLIEGSMSSNDRAKSITYQLEKDIKSVSEANDKTNSNLQKVKNSLDSKIESLPDYSKPILKLEMRIEAISSNINGLNDSFKYITKNIALKANKDELKKFFDELRLEMLNGIKKNDENLKNLEIKIKSLIQKQHNSDDGMKMTPNLFESINKIARDTMDNILGNNLTEYLSNNDLYKKNIEGTKINKEDIDKIFQSITDIRDSSLDKDKVENKLNTINEKMFDLTVDNKMMKTNIDDLIKNINGDGKDDNNHDVNKLESSHLSLRDQVKNITSALRVSTEKVDKVKEKVDNMNSEILIRIKRDLNCKYIMFRINLLNMYVCMYLFLISFYYYYYYYYIIYLLLFISRRH